MDPPFRTSFFQTTGEQELFPVPKLVQKGGGPGTVSVVTCQHPQFENVLKKSILESKTLIWTMFLLKLILLASMLGVLHFPVKYGGREHGICRVDSVWKFV